MLEVLIGFISGIISGTGMGGGTILILLLSIIMGLDQHGVASKQIWYSLFQLL